MRKKAQGLPMNVIILAVLGIIVLIMLVFIFQRYVGGSTTTIGEISGCDNQGGNCKLECNKISELKLSGMGCTEKKVCCLPKKIG